MNEDTIQITIVNHYRKHYAGLIAACPNGGKRGKLEAIHLKALGVLAGVPDLLIWSPKGHFLMEVKTSTGPVRQSQKRVIPQIQDLGFDVAIVRSAEEAARAFKAWGLPRKEACQQTKPDTGF